jgi:FAD/FMN-containing dehydrogenase
LELARGEDRYEAARRAAVWNRRTPERYPDRIVQAADEVDVVRAVESARAGGMRVGVRSGGHSWVGNQLRDGGLLLDVAQLRGVEIDADAMIASVGPGCPGNELAAALAAHELFFPGGHCPGVCVGGYLLQGGFGWNGRVHGPACMSVEAIDVVTADGERLRADADHHPDVLWAARGAGPGFFAVVTRFHLRCYPRPKVVANCLYLYPIELLDEVFRWVREIAPSLERIVELMVFVHRDAGGEPEIVVTGPVLADTDEQWAICC